MGSECLKENGRHEETRTTDLYRVNDKITSVFNNLHVTGRKRKSLKNKLEHNKAFLIVHELCTDVCLSGSDAYPLSSRRALLGTVDSSFKDSVPGERTSFSLIVRAKTVHHEPYTPNGVKL